jgi:hypothetical protein
MRFLLFILFFSLCISVNAAVIDFSNNASQTITLTFSNLDLVRSVKYIFYQGDNYLGEVNATDSVILDATKDYLVVIKPDRGVWFSDPLQTLNLVLNSMPQAFSIILGLGVAFLVLGLIARALGFRIGW